eukprot:jgi/Psemu1/61743/gm1.61743_g
MLACYFCPGRNSKQQQQQYDLSLQHKISSRNSTSRIAARIAPQHDNKQQEHKNNTTTRQGRTQEQHDNKKFFSFELTQAMSFYPLTTIAIVALASLLDDSLEDDEDDESIRSAAYPSQKEIPQIPYIILPLSQNI